MSERCDVCGIDTEDTLADSLFRCECGREFCQDCGDVYGGVCHICTGRTQAPQSQIEDLRRQLAEAKANICTMKEELRWYGHKIAGGAPIVGYATVAESAEQRWYKTTLPLLHSLETVPLGPPEVPQCGKVPQ